MQVADRPATGQRRKHSFTWCNVAMCWLYEKMAFTMVERHILCTHDRAHICWDTYIASLPPRYNPSGFVCDLRCKVNVMIVRMLLLLFCIDNYSLHKFVIRAIVWHAMPGTKTSRGICGKHSPLPKTQLLILFITSTSNGTSFSHGSIFVLTNGSLTVHGAVPVL
jgi:hypothetical protein